MTVAGRPDERKLDIVIAHYAKQNLEEVVHFWTAVSQLSNVQALSPYFFLYCKNSTVSAHELQWFSERGEVTHLKNVGRESHAYVHHIFSNYGTLAQQTIFHQALPSNSSRALRRLSLLSASTGMLALSLMTISLSQESMLSRLVCTRLYCSILKPPCKVGSIQSTCMNHFDIPAILYLVMCLREHGIFCLTAQMSRCYMIVTCVTRKVKLAHPQDANVLMLACCNESLIT